MSKLVGNRLPQEVVEAFDGTELDDKVGRAYLLVTLDENGAPRPCMLSAGEILAVDDQRLRVGLWRGTSTAGNLAIGSQALLCFVAPGTVYYVSGRPRALGEAEGVSVFEIAVERVESDSHAGMPVGETITYTVAPDDRGRVMNVWRRQIAVIAGR